LSPNTLGSSTEEIFVDIRASENAASVDGIQEVSRASFASPALVEPLVINSSKKDDEAFLNARPRQEKSHTKSHTPARTKPTRPTRNNTNGWIFKTQSTRSTHHDNMEPTLNQQVPGSSPGRRTKQHFLH
jgi:hypothetical protein